VVVVPKDHVVAAVDEVTAEDLADDIVLHPLDDTLDWEHPPGRPAIERPATTEDAIELVAAGVGLLVVPQSLARLHHRKDLTYRPVTDAPESRVALSWPEDRTTDHGRGLHRHRPRPDRQQLPGPFRGPVRAEEQGLRENGQRRRASETRRGQGNGQADRQEPTDRLRRPQGNEARKAPPQVLATARRKSQRPRGPTGLAGYSRRRMRRGDPAHTVMT
jgi:hypothetical protein